MCSLHATFFSCIKQVTKDKISSSDNIYNYLDQIWHKTKISIHASKVFDQEFCMWNPHFLLDKLDKPIFHKNLDTFASTYPYIHSGNMLFMNNTPYKRVYAL
jgi:hypothetical protein